MYRVLLRIRCAFLRHFVEVIRHLLTGFEGVMFGPSVFPLLRRQRRFGEFSRILNKFLKVIRDSQHCIVDYCISILTIQNCNVNVDFCKLLQS